MQLPGMLPPEFSQYAEASSDDSLLKLLTKNPIDLMIFLESAYTNVGWCQTHSRFMQAAFRWLATQALEDKISSSSLQRIAREIRNHFNNLSPYLPLNMTLEVEGKAMPVNSLLFSAASPLFYELIRGHYGEKGRTDAFLHDVPRPIFLLIEEYISTGGISALWRHDQAEIFILLSKATKFHLTGLMTLCQEVLKRYITKNNVMDIFLNAHQESWLVLKERCMEIIAESHWGIRLSIPSKDRYEWAYKPMTPLACEFLEFSDTALEIFNRLKEMITHLIISGSLTEESLFSQVMHACPHLILLDISQTRTLSPWLDDIPANLIALDLSKCSWLTNEHLKKIITLCPELHQLFLSSNVQLHYASWAALKDLHKLHSLDLSNCHQINDEDFTLILTACPHLTFLNVEGCKNLSDRSFMAIAHGLPQLTSLIMGHTNITDGPLVEICTYCKHLHTLMLTRCLEITRRGVNQATRLATELRVIDTSHCRL